MVRHIKLERYLVLRPTDRLVCLLIPSFPHPSYLHYIQRFLHTAMSESNQVSNVSGPNTETSTGTQASRTACCTAVKALRDKASASDRQFERFHIENIAESVTTLTAPSACGLDGVITMFESDQTLNEAFFANARAKIVEVEVINPDEARKRSLK